MVTKRTASTFFFNYWSKYFWSVKDKRTCLGLSTAYVSEMNSYLWNKWEYCFLLHLMSAEAITFSGIYRNGFNEESKDFSSLAFLAKHLFRPRLVVVVRLFEVDSALKRKSPEERKYLRTNRGILRGKTNFAFHIENRRRKTNPIWLARRRRRRGGM